MPQAVLAVAESAGVAGEWLRENGRRWLDELRSSAELVTDRLADLIVDVALTRTSGKVVVVSAFTEASSAVAGAVGHRRGESRVARHLATDSREQNVGAVERWLTDDNCVVLVCDASAEEGINLQAADLIIHLDLPWEAFRLEQRIGRCDRHADRRSAPVASAVAIYGDQPYASEWFAFLADGCGVFDRSVSSLQHVLAATERAVQYDVLIKGPEAFTGDLPEHAESLRAEAQRIAAHDSLDAVEVDHGEANSELRTLDGDAAFADSMVHWFEGVGGKVRRPSRGVVEFSGKPRPQVPFSLEAGIARWANSPLATHRPAAVERGLPILRAGNGLVDLLAEYLGNDDRGVAYACFRPTKGHWPPTPIFRSDFLVLAGDHEELVERARLLGVETWVRQVIEEALPPVVETIHLLPNGDEVTLPAATRPYSKASGDRNLGSRPEAFDRLTSGMDWEQLCTVVQPLARRVLDQRQSVRSRPTSASALVRQQIASRDRRLRARAAAGLDAEGNGQLGDLTEAVPEVLETAIETLGCGVTIFADPHRAGIGG
jgi:ATP-dependent helicase HepA